MIYTTLLEPYHYPRILPIEVTVLRGARRLRLATPLRRKYSDFVPKIWNILAKLGYQKYLQKIYVSMDVDSTVTSPYYQLPIVTAILEAVGMLKLRSNIYSIGRFLADYSLSYPEEERKGTVFPNLYTTRIEKGEKLEQYLNKIHTLPEKLQAPEYSNQDLFPGIVFDNGKISINRTTLEILKKLPSSSILESVFTISIRKKGITEKKLAWLHSSQHPKKTVLEYKKCFCEKDPCVCTKKERLLHTEQMLILKEYSALR